MTMACPSGKGHGKNKQDGLVRLNQGLLYTRFKLRIGASCLQSDFEIDLYPTLGTSIFTDLAPRPIQSISCDGRVSVCLSVHSRKQHFPMD